MKTSRSDIEAGFMKKRSQFYFTILAVAAVLLCLCSLPAFGAEPIQMGIMTGGPKGTYYQFGLNLQELVKGAGIDLRVDNSKGSVENIYAVYQKPKTQLGIVQSDVLAFVAKVETNPVLKRIAQKTRMVFPLYNEEIHLLAKKNILDFDYLIRLCPKIPGRCPATAYCTAVRRGQPGAGLD